TDLLTISKTKDQHTTMLTLPLMLFIVLIELCVGQFTVMYVLDWRHSVKRSFLILYAFIYLFLTGLTYLFQQGFSSSDLLNSFNLLDHHWTGSLTTPLVLFLILLIPYMLFLLLDKKAGIANDGNQPEGAEGEVTKPAISVLYILRMLSGGLAVLAGLATLFVVGMIYHPLGGSVIGGWLVVAGFFAAALALGGVMTAMWLGHWYLVTPAMTEKPLLLSTTLVLVGVALEVIFFLIGGAVVAPAQASISNQSPPAITATATVAPSTHTTAATAPVLKTANVPSVTPLSTSAIGWIRILVGFAIPLILGSLSWKLVRDRSFQSATGMLYLIVVCTLAGEIMARGLFLIGLQ
ncbi:MAG: hypothetical protein ACRDHZ_09525, partial [Ktedonobacteraceae bacterium]